MNLQTIALLLATHVGLGVYADIIGFVSALKDYETRIVVDPITSGPRPRFKWELFSWRVAGGVVAALLAIAGVSQPIGGLQ